MKTTVEIADSLFEEAKICARSKGVPLRRLIEEGLRTVIDRNKQPSKKFQLRDGSFGGDGPVVEMSWEEVRKVIYEGRGE